MPTLSVLCLNLNRACMFACQTESYFSMTSYRIAAHRFVKNDLHACRPNKCEYVITKLGYVIVMLICYFKGEITKSESPAHRQQEKNCNISSVCFITDKQETD